LFLLPSVRIDLLIEVALVRDQCHGHDGKIQVSRGLDGVTRKDTEAAAVSRDIIFHADLHGKIGDQGLGGKFLQIIHNSPLCIQS
jgi:hypothetical protein